MAPKTKGEETVERAMPLPRRKSVLREYAEALIIAVLLALVIRTFVVQAFKIPSGSMLPTLQIGDHILVNKFIYTFRPIQRGDIIVFKFPQDESRDFIKRVVGLPGERVEIRAKQLFINGKPLQEPYAVHTAPGLSRGAEGEELGPITIPEGRLFMLGDNRDHSMDSRYWGLLDIDKVRGKAFLIYFSVKSDELPTTSSVGSIAYVLTHPTSIRWNRLGSLVE